jgi:hypothetical protein
MTNIKIGNTNPNNVVITISATDLFEVSSIKIAKRMYIISEKLGGTNSVDMIRANFEMIIFTFVIFI